MDYIYNLAMASCELVAQSQGWMSQLVFSVVWSPKEVDLLTVKEWMSKQGEGKQAKKKRLPSSTVLYRLLAGVAQIKGVPSCLKIWITRVLSISGL